MHSIKISAIGLIVLILGVAILFTHFANLTNLEQLMQLGGLLSLCGAALFMIGFVGSVGSEIRATKGLHANDSAVFTIAFLRCMIAISIADNDLDDTEVKEISRIHKHLVGHPLSEEVIRETAKDMMEQDFNIIDELGSASKTLNKDIKEKLIIASLYILAADGKMDDDEELMLECIQQGLYMSAGRVRKLKKNFLKKRNIK